MKSLLLYYFILIPFSYLPLRVLFIISDFIFFVLFHIMGYRRKVVYNNLKNSFPDKSETELRSYEKEFFRHLCDLMVESVKTFSISAEKSIKHLKIVNPEVMDQFFKQGKDIVGVGGHNGNWELYAVACVMQIEHRVAALYTPMSNKVFDEKMRKSRSRFGLNMVPTSNSEALYQETGEPTMYTFGIDQCPRSSQKAYWMEFLNQETGVQFGAEKFAREHNMPVIFGNIHKVKRGYYEVIFEVVCEDPSQLEVGEIMRRSTVMLESSIKKQPSYWLWSHKRWKRKKADCVPV